MISKIQISNFKSLGSIDIDLDPVTVLIGRSGTGKSNFVKAIRFFRNCIISNNLAQVVEDFGGKRSIYNTNASPPFKLAF
jgi:predicted ATPase